jgi:hypothetical protein
MKYHANGLTFSRDQGAKKGDLYYRRYRCKGKQSKQCDAQLGVDAFIQHATSCIGKVAVAAARIICNIPDGPRAPPPPRKPKGRRHNFSQSTSISNTSSGPSPSDFNPSIRPTTPLHPQKRSHDIGSTGVTPRTKRTDIKRTPIKYSTEIEHLRQEIKRLTHENELLKANTNVQIDSGTLMIYYLNNIESDVQHNVDTPSLSQFPMDNDDLSSFFHQSPIPPSSDLASPFRRGVLESNASVPLYSAFSAQRQALGNTTPERFPETMATPSTAFNEYFIPPLITSSPHSSDIVLDSLASDSEDRFMSPTPHHYTKPLDCVPSSTDASATDNIKVPSSSSSKQLGKTSFTATLTPTPKRIAEHTNKVKAIYLLNVLYDKVGKVRNYLRIKGIRTDDVINLSWIGKKVLECLVLESGFKQFKHMAEKHGLGLLTSFDPTDPHDSNWKVINGGEMMSRPQLQANFIYRVALDSVRSNDPRVGEIFARWATEIKRKAEFEKRVEELRRVYFPR